MRRDGAGAKFGAGGGDEHVMDHRGPSGMYRHPRARVAFNSTSFTGGNNDDLLRGRPRVRDPSSFGGLGKLIVWSTLHLRQ